MQDLQISIQYWCKKAAFLAEPDTIPYWISIRAFLTVQDLRISGGGLLKDV
jgi:hypothetical protein